MSSNEETAAAAPTVCEQGGAEQTPIGIRVGIEDVVEFSAWICSAPARVRVYVADSSGEPQPLIDQVITSNVSVTLPRLQPGLHVLLWSYTIPVTPWQTRSEVSVQQINRFRQRKSNTSNDPVQRGFLNIEVLP